MALGSLFLTGLLSVSSLGLFAPPPASGRAVEVSDDEVVEDDYAVPQEEYGPFFEAPAPSEVTYPSERKGDEATAGWFSVGGDPGPASFCFVEDAPCQASLIADADIGAGLNVVGSERGIDVPMTQFRFRGGFTVRPITLAKKRWHPWSFGVIANWSQASPQVRGSSVESLDLIRELSRVRSVRVALINQIWLKNRRNAFHLDFTFGGVNTNVLDAQGTFWGTTTEVAFGWAGWAALFASLDFLDRDTRMIFGFRTHAVGAAPIVGALLLGLLAGGAL